MAYVTPGTVAAGDVATAAAWNVITNDILQFAPYVQGVFTNEAARDAAITSPTEGMHVYLTAPTVPAATGGETFIPTGIITIYNGSVWVCVTPVSALQTATGTTTSASYTATLSGSPGTNPSVTLVTGTTALLHISSSLYNTTQGSGANAAVSVAVSGAGVVAAAEKWGLALANAAIARMTVTSVISGLTAGTNTFTLQYLRTVSGTGEFSNRALTVTGIA